MSKYLSVKPGDLIETRFRMYHVAGVHIGALGQESVVELVPLDATRPDMHGETVHPLVPMHWLCEMFINKLITVTPTKDQP